MMAGLVHAAAGLQSKAMFKQVHLGIMLLCVYFLDILTIPFGVLKIDLSRNAIYSHSLLAALFWSLVVGAVAYRYYGNARTASLLATLVFSHWIIDFITWPMTGVMPEIDTGVPLLLSEEPNIGLGLWKNAYVAYIGEFGTLVLGLYMYLKARKQ